MTETRATGVRVPQTLEIPATKSSRVAGTNQPITGTA